MSETNEEDTALELEPSDAGRWDIVLHKNELEYIYFVDGKDESRQLIRLSKLEEISLSQTKSCN